CPGWAHHIAVSFRKQADNKTPTDHIPDNGVVERFHKTMLDEFYRIAFRKKIYAAIDDLQADLDLLRMREFNEARPHQGKRRFGKAPLQTFLDAPPNREKKNASRSPAAPNPPPHDRHRPAHAVRQVK
ncbi:MAG TPA: integrase core domain-containing protein, partial [Roseiarcus sp.]|nr:integrase core domain-containing protein [Roseiarcus sp.]